MQLINLWNLGNALGNVAQMTGKCKAIPRSHDIGSLFYLTHFIQIIEMGDFIIGIGCMLAWISLIKYLEDLQLYSLIFRTVSISMPLVWRTLLASLPIFLGMTYLSMSLFWESDRF